MTEALQQVDEFIRSKGLIIGGDNLLVTVSGGMDSMFLVHYLINKKYRIAVAHCNFGLRDDESDGDETFVRVFCETHAIKCHFKKFETERYANTHKISIQMAARDLRYQWFNELCETENYTKIVTAHHKTDNAETILLNILRGTGLKGMEGITPLNGNKIRPLLCLSREEIRKAVAHLKIEFREDSSNSSDKYYRNRLRLNILPELKKINPEFENTIESNAEVVRQANGFINHYIELIKKEIVKEKKETTTIDIDGLLKLPEQKFILFNILSDFGFNASDTDDIFKSLKGTSGKQFYSSTHRLIKDRKQIIIELISSANHTTYEILPETKTLDTPHHHWQFEINNNVKDLPNSKNEACIDLEKIKFPLTIRLWQHGDKLKPLGMTGHKKVSDILIDKKLSITEKDKVWVVVSDKKIVWVTGMVINEDYRLTGETMKVFNGTK